MQLDELEILLASLHAVSTLDNVEQEKKKLTTGQVHMIPFFLQEQQNIPLGLSFRERFGPFSPTLQNNLELAVSSGLVKTEEKDLELNSVNKVRDDAYWISASGQNYFNETIKGKMNGLLSKMVGVAESVVNTEYWELVGKVGEVWDENIKQALNRATPVSKG